MTVTGSPSNRSWRPLPTGPKAVDTAARLKRRAKQRPPTEDDAPKRPSTFPGKPPHIEGQLGLFGETAVEGGGP